MPTTIWQMLIASRCRHSRRGWRGACNTVACLEPSFGPRVVVDSSRDVSPRITHTRVIHLSSKLSSSHACIPAPLGDNFVQCPACGGDCRDHQRNLVKGPLGGAASNEVGGAHHGNHTDIHELEVFSCNVTREEQWGLAWA